MRNTQGPGDPMRLKIAVQSRVARYLVSGNGGYRAVTEGLKLNA
jgi:ribosomal protein S6E (S10)